jgi:hypothetical protein
LAGKNEEKIDPSVVAYIKKAIELQVTCSFGQQRAGTVTGIPVKYEDQYTRVWIREKDKGGLASFLLQAVNLFRFPEEVVINTPPPPPKQSVSLHAKGADKK